ncbi:hypothetical protein CVT25_011551 [Psilocybe cyanescens]|uniref:G domain-containing protein n=1 Tax=Psilocybe cyanescens TaxID=93625 RepID=A0A409VVD6_PSICY|nr:hypothetical protein CVT25_011551 [Psilocybe cyanescens]
MGVTGVGKSTFINTILGEERVTVGHNLESCTTEMNAVPVDTSQLGRDFPCLENRRLLLVDTPGFNSAETEDVEVLEKTAMWLKRTYNTQVLGGVIYLHDISIERYTSTARKTLYMFSQICGQDALDRIALGATKVNRLTEGEASKRLDRLKESHWKTMINEGLRVFPVDKNSSAAWDIFINSVVGKELMTVGHEIDSCTTEVLEASIDTSPFILDFPWLANRRVVLVDTPGFNDTYKEDADILRMIIRRLEKSYKTQIPGGVVYLHDLSADRYKGIMNKSLTAFCDICGEDVYDRVILATTKADRLLPDAALKRLGDLKKSHWRMMINKGTQVSPIDTDPSSASNLIRTVLKCYWKKGGSHSR